MKTIRLISKAQIRAVEFGMVSRIEYIESMLRKPGFSEVDKAVFVTDLEAANNVLNSVRWQRGTKS